MSEQHTLVVGFIGLGVMGGAMCRNIALKHTGPVIAFDANPAAFAALEGTQAQRAATVADVAAQADIVFLSLPGGPQVESVCLGAQGLTSGAHKPSAIVDLSTTTVASARDVAARLAAVGVGFADAPVARTREAAQRGQVSMIVMQVRVQHRVGPRPRILQRQRRIPDQRSDPPSKHRICHEAHHAIRSR